VVTTTQAETLRVFATLQPGDRIEIEHEIKIGSSKSWQTKTTGTVIKTDRRRHGLHYQRNVDDKVFFDVIVMTRDDGEQTTVTLDEFSVLRKLD